MNLSSKLIEEAVNQLSSLPSIGRKSALRLVLHLLKKSPDEVEQFSNSFTQLINNINYCKSCHNLSDAELCSICANPNRNQELVCIVEDIRDVMAIESTQQFNGIYHVLGGVISPMDGIGPSDLNFSGLFQKAADKKLTEIVLALSATMEGDTTNFYIFKKLKDYNLKITTIARGVAIGDELEYTDEITLGRSIVNRMPYNIAVNN